jgi:hypothetical protein
MNAADITKTTTKRTTTRIQIIEEAIGLPALFVLASGTIGLTAGFITGGITAILKNLAETPAARPHILRTTRAFGTNANLGLFLGVETLL